MLVSIEMIPGTTPPSRMLAGHHQDYEASNLNLQFVKSTHFFGSVERWEVNCYTMQLDGTCWAETFADF